MYSEMSNLILNSDNMEVVDSRKILLQQQHHFHVLAVDDSLTDRKLLERLLIAGSSCKGIYIYHFLFSIIISFIIQLCLIFQIN